MDDLIKLINHLINAKYSIDTVESIVDQLNIPKDQIYRILRADRYKDYFQFLKKSNQGKDKIALTLDVSFYSLKIHIFNFSVLSSFSVVHIMLNNVKINPVHFCTCVRTIFDRCMANVRIKLVHMIMKF